MDNILEDGVIVQLAKDLFNEYSRKKALLLGKAYRPNNRLIDLDTWGRVAKEVQKLHADPDVYIEAQFQLAKSQVFPNSLHGPVAKKRYRTYCMMKANRGVPLDTEEAAKLEETLTDAPAKELEEDLTDTYRSLQYYCGGTDLNDPAVASKALGIYLHFDPLCMLLINPTPQFKQVFGRMAKKRLEQHPSLRRAAIDAGFDIAVEYIEEEDTNA